MSIVDKVENLRNFKGVTLRVFDKETKNEIDLGYNFSIIKGKAVLVETLKNLPSGKYNVLITREDELPTDGWAVKVHSSVSTTLISPYFIKRIIDKGQTDEYEIQLTGQEKFIWVVRTGIEQSNDKTSLGVYFYDSLGKPVNKVLWLEPNVLTCIPVWELESGKYTVQISSTVKTTYHFGVEYANSFSRPFLTDYKMTKRITTEDRLIYDVSCLTGVTELKVKKVSGESGSVKVGVVTENGDEVKKTFANTGDEYSFPLEDAKRKIVFVEGESGNVTCEFSIQDPEALTLMDSFEYNDTVNTSKQLRNGDKIYANISSLEDVDYYKLDLPFGAFVKFSLDNIPEGVNYGMKIYDSANNLMSDLTGSYKEGKVINLNKGSYYIQISSEEGYSGQNYLLYYSNMLVVQNLGEIGSGKEFEVTDVHPEENLYLILYPTQDGTIDYGRAPAKYEVEDIHLVTPAVQNEPLKKQKNKSNYTNVNLADINSLNSTLFVDTEPLTNTYGLLNETIQNLKLNKDEVENTSQSQFWFLGTGPRKATLIAKGDNSLFWLDNKFLEEKGMELNEQIICFKNEFEEVREKMQDVFGNEPSIEKFGFLKSTSQKVNVFFTPFGENDNAIGYFYWIDLDPSYWYSNKRKVLYVNTKGFNSSYLETVLHEYQHLLFYTSRKNTGRLSEDYWLNEGFSCIATDVLDLSEYRNIYNGHIQHYFGMLKDISVIFWYRRDRELSVANYGSSYLFAWYIYKHYGSQNEFFKAVYQTVADPREEIVKLVAKNGEKNDDGMEKNFNQIFQDWAIATLLGDKISNYNKRYGYLNYQMPTHSVKDYILSSSTDIQKMDVASWGLLGIYIDQGNQTEFKVSVKCDVKGKFEGVLVRWRK